MRILSIHNRYLQRGGEDESSKLEVALLREKGHQVFEQAADNHQIEGRSLVGIGLRSIWNPASYSRTRELIREHQIDLVKVDNFFPQISPAIFYAAHAAGIPTVQSLRNYRLICPGATFFRDGKVCEDCKTKLVPWPSLLHGCYRESRAQTLAPAAMATAHRMAGTWKNRVTAFIALSEFSRRKFIEGGLPADRIHVKPNFVFDHGIGDGKDASAVYVGRLSPEKGVDTLLSGWRRIGERLKLKIVGGGPLEPAVRECAASVPSIEYLGPRSLEETYEIIGNATVLIFPSTCYETFGRSVAEAFAKGTPVIASNLGNIATMVTHRVNGLHFESGSAESLAGQVEWMLEHSAEWRAMRLAARTTYEELYSPARNYQMMMDIFDRAVAAKPLRPIRENAVA